jgi:hypothetical protein
MFGTFGDTTLTDGTSYTYYPVNRPYHPKLAAARNQADELQTKLAVAQAQKRAAQGPSAAGTFLKVAAVAVIGYLVITGAKSH